ncbi:type III secretion protein HrpB4 [Cupriavidus plantarum]|nr:hypothetical protein LMG26296_02534 [Cupriavidus plantarum]SMR84909.1 type III secretion protein (HrpB4) [Cupriavidus plantarum]
MTEGMPMDCVTQGGSDASAGPMRDGASGDIGPAVQRRPDADMLLVSGGAGIAGTPAELAMAMTALRAYAARLEEGVAAAGLGRSRRWARAALLADAVPAEAFLRPVARLCVAEPARRRQALVLRALFARRSALRRCIDRASLSALSGAVGDAALLTQLRGAAAEDGETAIALPPTLDADALAHDGLARLIAGEPAAGSLAVLAGYGEPPYEVHPKVRPKVGPKVGPEECKEGRQDASHAAGADALPGMPAGQPQAGSIGRSDAEEPAKGSLWHWTEASAAEASEEACKEANKKENAAFFHRLTQWMPELT